MDFQNNYNQQQYNQPYQQNQPQYNYNQNSIPQTQKKKFPIWAIILIIIGVLCCCCFTCVGYLFVQGTSILQESSEYMETPSINGNLIGYPWVSEDENEIIQNIKTTYENLGISSIEVYYNPNSEAIVVCYSIDIKNENYRKIEDLLTEVEYDDMVEYTTNKGNTWMILSYENEYRIYGINKKENILETAQFVDVENLTMEDINIILDAYEMEITIE